ncbi:MAG: hypothetical protein P1U46_04500 [Patescibacteria group bacterium]|nr:hypothetical protein [Patescibacteria group bacterium]
MTKDHHTSSSFFTKSSLEIFFHHNSKLPVIHTFLSLNIEFHTIIFSLK